MTEQNKHRPSKVLRGIAIALFGLAVTFTLLGAVGTTCAAFGAEKYDSMILLVPYKPLYQALVVISLAVGVWGIWIVRSLVRGGSAAYRNALLVLCLGALSAGIQMGVSQSVRGSSSPVNVRFYISVFTLVVFLLLRLPPVWVRFDFTQSVRGSGTKPASTGTVLIVCGIVTLATRFWVGSTHITPQGNNWVNVIELPLQVCGWGMVVGGVTLLLNFARLLYRQNNAPNPRTHPTGLCPRKSAGSRAFSELSTKGAHAASARQVIPSR